MNKKFLAASAICLLSLSACGHKTDAAANVAAMADNQADAIDANASALRDVADNKGAAVEASMDNKADRLSNKADAIRSAGENKADAIDDAAKK